MRFKNITRSKKKYGKSTPPPKKKKSISKSNKLNYLHKKRAKLTLSNHIVGIKYLNYIVRALTKPEFNIERKTKFNNSYARLDIYSHPQSNNRIKSKSPIKHQT